MVASWREDIRRARPYGIRKPSMAILEEDCIRFRVDPAYQLLRGRG